MNIAKAIHSSYNITYKSSPIDQIYFFSPLFMSSIFFPPEVTQLTESTSITLAQRIQCQPIATNDRPISTAYLHEGKGGTPILLLHGFDSSVMEFRRLLPLLAPANETWAIDLLGFGFTERIPGITPETIKAHLYACWQSLIDRPVILVGVSMGGAAAIDFSITYPEAVKKLVLIDSAGFAKAPAMQGFWLTPLVYLGAEFLRQPKVREYVSKKAYYDRKFASSDANLCASLHLKMPNWRQGMVDFTKTGGYGFLADRISEVKQETLILWGDSDKILGTSDAERFQRAIGGSKLIWIEECGHVPHLEKPEITAKHILAFRD